MVLHGGVALFLSGRIAPLALLPPAVAGVAAVLWFPYMLAFPVNLLTGSVHGTAALLHGFAGQIVWLALWVGAYRLAWTRGLRRYGAVGGGPNAERGRRNAGKQCELERRGPPRTKPTMMFRIPRSAFRVLAALWRLNLAEELQYRANFVASVLGTLFWIGTALLTLALFFRHTTRLGGWHYWEVVVLLGVFNALTGVIEAVLRAGIRPAAGGGGDRGPAPWPGARPGAPGL